MKSASSKGQSTAIRPTMNLIIHKFDRKNWNCQKSHIFQAFLSCNSFTNVINSEIQKNYIQCKEFDFFLCPKKSFRRTI